MAKQDELWHAPSLDKKSAIPAPIAHEYYTLYELVEKGEIYQAVVKLKDVADLSYRIAVLTVTAYLSSKFLAKGDSAETAYAPFSKFITQPASLGTWEEQLGYLKGHFSDELPPGIADMLIRFCKLKNELKMSEYRNEYIGHGAYMAFASEELLEDTEKKLKELAKHLEKMQTLWESFTINLRDIPQRGWYAARHPGFMNEPVTLTCGDVCVKPDKLILFENGRYFMFDKYNRTTGAAEYLCFSDGKRLSRGVALFSDLCSAYDGYSTRMADGNLQDSVTDYDLSVTFDEISNLAMDFVEDKSITQWLQNCLDRHGKGVFVLQGGAASGKSAYCAALDPLLSPFDYISLEDTEVRCYYASRSAVHHNMDFANFTSTAFNIKNIKGRRSQIFTFSKKTIQPSEKTTARDIADMLNEWHEIHLRHSEKHTGKILYVIDGVDRMITANPALAGLIPDSGMLADGVYILLTTRSYRPQNITITAEKSISPSDTAKLAKDIINSVAQKILGSGINKIPPFISAELSMTQMAASVIKYDGNRSIKLGVGDMAKRYLEILMEMYGIQLSEQARNMINVLTKAEKPLSLQELCYAVDYGQVSLTGVGILRDLSCFIESTYSPGGMAYRIKPQFKTLLQQISD